jgi:hypothetical protein
VVEFDAQGNAISLEQKPYHHQSERYHATCTNYCKQSPAIIWFALSVSQSGP